MVFKSKVLVGKKIRGFCGRAPIKCSEKGVIDRQHKVILEKHTGRRKLLVRSFVDIPVSINKKSGTENQWIIQNRQEINRIESTLKNIYGCGFENETSGKGITCQNPLIGECSGYKHTEGVSHVTSNHGGHIIDMSCDIFAICYPKLPNPSWGRVLR